MKEIFHNGRLYMITSDHCPGCEVAKNMYKKEIESGEITVIDMDDPKANDLIKKLDIMKVPTLLICEGDENCSVVA